MRHLVLFAATLAIVAPAPLVAADSDQQVADQIANNLKNSGRLRGYEIAVKYREGTARLEGWVRDQEQMEAALDIVRRTPQVENVINRLQIQPQVAAVPQPGPAPALVHRTTHTQPPMVQPVAAPYHVAQWQGGTLPPPQGTPRPMPPAYRGPMPEHVPGTGGGVAPAVYDQPYLPNYAWPSYAAYPNYAALSYPRVYSPTAWPYIGPFYPYPQVPLGWRKVTLEWDDGWWFLNFDDSRRHCHK
jgi:hypothetical protein